MGGTSQTTQQQQQQSQLTPWAPAAGQIQGILGGLDPSIANLGGGPGVSSALGQLSSIAGQPNPLGAPALNAAGSQLGGAANYGNATGILNNAYDTTRQSLSPYTTGNAFDPSSNPALRQQLDTVTSDVNNSINPQFAAAGRLFSPDNAQAVARGITQGSTGILQNAAGNQLNAIGQLQGAAGNTAGGLLGADTANAGIQSQGIGNAATAYGTQALGPQAQLNAALMQNQLPIQNAGALTGILGPLAAQFGQQNASGSASGTQTKSPIDQALAFSQMFGNIFGGSGNGAAGNASKLIFG